MSLPRLFVRIALSTGVALALLAPVAATASAATTLPRSSPSWRACTRTLDYVKTSLTATQRTVIIVNQTSKTYANVSFYVRMYGPCSLKRMFITKTARLGYGGTVPGPKRKQGTGVTPLGTYTMTETFGNGSAPSTSMPYHQVKSGDYWVQDRSSRFYNTLRNKSQGGFRWSLPTANLDSSEKLSAYGAQYRYAVVINFNRAPDTKVAGRGSGIFLHVKGSGATGGCVAVSADQMRTVMAYLRPADRITIAL